VTAGDRLERFTAFSAAVTGFTAFDVRGTGLTESFLSTITEILGDELVDELLGAWGRAEAAAQSDAAKLENVLRREMFSDEKLGPIARNVVKLWYVGIWYELPREWMDSFGMLERNDTFIVSAVAYTESLVWPAIGANPPGAKGPGYGSWAGPPQIADGATR
jgi:hypothetical protein